MWQESVGRARGRRKDRQRVAREGRAGREVPRAGVSQGRRGMIIGALRAQGGRGGDDGEAAPAGGVGDADHHPRRRRQLVTVGAKRPQDQMREYVQLQNADETVQAHVAFQGEPSKSIKLPPGTLSHHRPDDDAPARGHRADRAQGRRGRHDHARPAADGGGEAAAGAADDADLLLDERRRARHRRRRPSSSTRRASRRSRAARAASARSISSRPASTRRSSSAPASSRTSRRSPSARPTHPARTKPAGAAGRRSTSCSTDCAD